MNIVFTDLFKDTCQDEFQIPKKRVRQAINSPDSQQIERFNNLELGFFTKRESQAEGESYLLICARREDNNWLVDLGFRILPDLGDDLETLEPLELLRKFVVRFGLEIRIGRHRRKFVFRESIPCESQGNDLTDLAEILSPASQGLLYPIVKVEQQGSNVLINCALAFCIDTGEYSSWLFGWDAKQQAPIKLSFEAQENIDVDTSSYCLTDEEQAAVDAFVKEKFPDDEYSQTEWAKFRGACVLLKKIFGNDWYEANVAPYSSHRSTFLRRSLSDEEERYLYVTRVIELAEALHSLEEVPGLSQCVDQNRGKTLESLWFEFFVPYLIQKSGHRILEFVPENQEKKTPDLVVEFYDQLISVEIKAKKEKKETPYARRKLLYLLSKAFKQLPDSGPGVVFLMVHLHWLQNQDFLRQAESVINQALLRSRNCNAIFVLWPLSERLPSGEFIYHWRFQHFVTWHPMYTIPRITDLIAKREMTYEPMQVTFIEAVV